MSAAPDLRVTAAPYGSMSELPDMWALPIRMGWSVIPLRARDKLPSIKWTEYQRRVPDRAEVKCWADQGGNVGIVTGMVSRLLVLDLDNAAAIDEAATRGIPSTVTVATAKGMHCYFAHPGGKIGNRAGIFPDADVRGDGGYVVAPGSIHPTGVRYTWIAAPPETRLAYPPPWLLSALDPPHIEQTQQSLQQVRRARSQPLAGECTPYGRAALERESEAVRCAMRGEQETTLNAAGLKLGALVAGKELTHAFARRGLVQAGMCMANHDAGNRWTLDAVTAKVDRALADGAAFPRSAPEMQGVRHG